MPWHAPGKREDTWDEDDRNIILEKTNKDTGEMKQGDLIGTLKKRYFQKPYQPPTELLCNQG